MSGMKMDKAEMKRMLQNPMFRNMMGDEADNIEGLLEDEQTVNQMAGFWKHLDEMSSTDKKGYDEFIKKQGKDHQEWQKEEEKRKEKERIITGDNLCCLKIWVSKVLVQKPAEKKELSETIKLFDFDKNTQMQESMLENKDQEDKPLDQPKIYLNILYHDDVVPPLKGDKTEADPKNDKEWAIIPIYFSQTKERWSGSGMKCIHVDAFIHTCVSQMFRTSVAKIGAITNFILQKFQQVLKDHYVFHKKTIKALKSKKYKAWRGKNDVKQEIVLPEAYHKKHFKKAMKKVKDMVKAMNPGMPDEPEPKKQEPIKMPTMEQQAKDAMNQLKDGQQKEANIIIPGMNKDEPKKKFMMEVQSDKYKPNVEIKEMQDSYGQKQVQYIFNVEDEKSAKDIEIDVSSTELKLNSANYEFKEAFKGFEVDEDSVKAKFSKKNGTLTLTINKFDD